MKIENDNRMLVPNNLPGFVVLHKLVTTKRWIDLVLGDNKIYCFKIDFEISDKELELNVLEQFFK